MSDILPHVSSPDEQFTLGVNLIQKAYSTKQAQYNTEVVQIRNYAKQKNDENNELRIQVNELRRELKDKEERTRLIEESLIKTRAERDNLLEQIKRLNRDFHKLLQFKKTIIASINEEELGENIGSYLGEASLSNRINNALDASLSSRSLNNSPMSTHSSIHSSPSKTYTITPGGTSNNPNVVEGKAFFRKAKLELPHEAFVSFLNCIKKFNAKQATRDETLKAVKAIFGTSYEDLYTSFERILDKHGDSFNN